MTTYNEESTLTINELSEKDASKDIQLSKNIVQLPNKDVKLPNKEAETGEAKGTAPFEWNCSSYMLLFELSLVIFFNFGSFSILATFFPSEASRLGASRAEIGFIFGTYPLVAFPASIIYGVLIPKIGADKVLWYGIFTNGITVLMFAFVNHVTNSRLFVASCMILRILAAIGGAACETTIRAIVLTDFGHKNIGFCMGVLSTATEFGFTVGPFLGGTLYSFGGFKLPFLVVGGLLLSLLFIIFFALPKKEVVSKSTDMKRLFKTLHIPGVALMVIVIVVLISDLSVIDPTLAPHVKDIDSHVGAAFIGFIFLLNGVVVAILSPMAGWICDKTNCINVLLVSGLVVGAISLFMMGPAPFLTSILPTKKIWLVCVAMAVNGGSAALTIPPAVTLMSMYSRDGGMPDDLTTNGILSGLVTAACNLGSFTGPAIGGVVMEWIGFNWCVALFGIISIFQAVFTALFSYYWRPSKESMDYQSVAHEE